MRDGDRFRDQCGLFGIYGHPEAANLTYLGLYALQHRGQESAGIVSSDGQSLHAEMGMGLVADVFTEGRLARLPGHIAVGHNRYSTSGSNQPKNIQPILGTSAQVALALAHNGNLTNAPALRQQLEAEGALFRSDVDSEVIVHLIAQSREGRFADRVADALQAVQGAYTLLILNGEELVGVRDPCGFRPLVVGRRGEAWVLASETCALDLIEARTIREVEPGEMVVVDRKGLRSYRPLRGPRVAQCIFELIYLARPDSRIFGHSVYEVRLRLGERLAREAPADADMVIPVPDSGLPAALGYARASGLPFDMALIRNHYVGRTFIEPQHSIRHFGVKLKLNPLPGYLEGKRVVVVDDSIVRGTTSRKIVHMVRQAGAREVHVRISSPPITHPCFFGIDTPTRGELIGAYNTVEETCRFLGADSLRHLSMEGMLEAVRPFGGLFCNACFSGAYPIPVAEEEERQLSLFRLQAREETEVTRAAP